MTIIATDKTECIKRMFVPTYSKLCIDFYKEHIFPVLLEDSAVCNAGSEKNQAVILGIKKEQFIGQIAHAHYIRTHDARADDRFQ